MKTQTTVRVAVLAALMTGLLSWSAAAWGPRAQQSITAMSMQVIRTKHNPNAFKPPGRAGANFEKDVMRGSADGHAMLQRNTPLMSDADAVQAVSAEIQLLRDALKYGPSSYFAYRMGVLGSLVSDLIVPYGFAWTPSDDKIQRRVFRDIDKHLDSYGFTPQQRHRQYVRDAREYFRTRRPFYMEDKRIIQEDYLGGLGYAGFLKGGGRAYFGRAVEAVADVWHTVFRHEPDASQVSASKTMLTWYFVDEIEYSLTVKNNTTHANAAYANAAYANFEMVNPDLPAAFDRIGTLFYDCGTTTSKLRGVREWGFAYEQGGHERAEVGRKLAEHYLGVGKEILDTVEDSQHKMIDLANAIHALEQAIEYDRTNPEIVELIQQANIRQQELEHIKEMTVGIIAQAEQTREEADRSRLNSDYGKAVATYRTAATFYAAVDSTFPDLERSAKEGIKKVNKDIKDVTNEVLDMASQAIDDGNTALEEKAFEDAIASYESVAGIVAQIPGEDDERYMEDKLELIQLAEGKVREAKDVQVQYQEILAEQQRQAGGAAQPSR